MKALGVKHPRQKDAMIPFLKNANVAVFVGIAVKTMRGKAPRQRQD